MTVKRVAGGVVSNWIADSLAEGDTLESTRPAGHFCLGPAAGGLVAYAGGSGITPVFSLLKTALETTSRRVRLLYANRDRESAIFAAELDALAKRYPRPAFGRPSLRHSRHAADSSRPTRSAAMRERPTPT